MTTKINDSHGYFFGASKWTAESRFFPANCKIIDNKMVVTEIVGDNLAQADNIKIGDVITKINDKTIKEHIEENRDLICASNEAAYLDRVAKAILSFRFRKC